MKLLDIADVVSATGVRPSTLRYYEQIGLIASVARHGLRRQYEPQTLVQLQLIDLGKTAGFALTDIAAMFGADGQPNLSRSALHARADQIERQIGELTSLKNAIRHVAECPAPTHMECPSFQRLLRLSAKSGQKRRPSRSWRAPKPSGAS